MTFHFGKMTVTSQVFYHTPLSYALVNIKPLLPGHVLVCPRRVVPRLTQMTVEETGDFYSTVQLVTRMLEREYQADGINISIQDGAVAGQTVPHVHCHIIPRKISDLPNGIEIHRLLDKADLSEEFDVIKRNRIPQAIGPDSESRVPRLQDEMEQEANRLRELMTAST